MKRNKKQLRDLKPTKDVKGGSGGPTFDIAQQLEIVAILAAVVGMVIGIVLMLF